MRDNGRHTFPLPAFVCDLAPGLRRCAATPTGTMNDPTWLTWPERLYRLRRDQQGPHERPHKPVLLLSIADFLDRQLIPEPRIPLSDELVRTFKRYFEIVRQKGDQPTIRHSRAGGFDWTGSGTPNPSRLVQREQL